MSVLTLYYFQLLASFLVGFTVLHGRSLFRLAQRKCYGEFVQSTALLLLPLLPRAGLLIGLLAVMSYLRGDPCSRASQIVLKILS